MILSPERWLRLPQGEPGIFKSLFLQGPARRCWSFRNERSASSLCRPNRTSHELCGGGPGRDSKRVRSPVQQLRCARSRTGFFCSIVLCAWLAIAKPLVAESLEDNPSVDMSALSCADLLRMPLPEALIVVGWIGGFYAGLRNDPTVQLSIFADDADRILNLCRTNQSTSVMTLVGRTFGLVRPPTRQGAQ